MTASIHLRTLLLTWALALLLIPCVGHITRMVGWCFLASCYLFVVLASLVDLHRIDESYLPRGEQ